MRKILYFTLLAICIIILYMFREHMCIQCIERNEGICITSSVSEVRDFIYKYTSCSKCKQ